MRAASRAGSSESEASVSSTASAPTPPVSDSTRATASSDPPSIAVAPNDPEALFNLGLCALHENRPDEARRIWESALGRVDRASRPMFQQGLARLAGG